ncbi:MAG: hypothetical protein KGJ62_12550 [Armatimonadetes bacterium]|nr:hypothetical protein [Armatimonadota bacterium]MDE2206920.1 hypothetical protein [Armatimonadota bacterium]
MNALKTAVLELYGLFVEDGSLAVAILVWAAVAVFVFPWVHAPGSWEAAVFFAGIIVLFLENIWRSARKR